MSPSSDVVMSMSFTSWTTNRSLAENLTVHLCTHLNLLGIAIDGSKVAQLDTAIAPKVAAVTSNGSLEVPQTAKLIDGKALAANIIKGVKVSPNHAYLTTQQLGLCKGSWCLDSILMHRLQELIHQEIRRRFALVWGLIYLRLPDLMP